MSANRVIDIEQALVSYRDNLALKGVSLAVGAGEFVGIIGPNGAGKTTLLTVVNGLARLHGGRVGVLGHDPAAGGGRPIRRKVGYVPQVEDIDPRMPMSVREVVMIGRYGVLGLLKRPGGRDWEIVDGMLELVGMSRLASRPIGHLSGGERQRVAIARCLAQQPEIFLLDEPTASLDWKAQVEILELVTRVHRERGLTTLFVTHDLDALPVHCGRVLLMKEGRIVADGPPAEVLTHGVLSSLYDMPAFTREMRQARVRPG